MKRRLIVCAVVTAICVGITGCGSDSGSSDTTAEVQKALDETSDAVDKLGDAISDSVTEAASEISGSLDEINDQITESQEDPFTMDGATETEWGDFVVSVPQGYELKGGDVFDDTDPNIFKVMKSDFDYIEFKSESDKQMMQNYNYNHDTYTNEQQDLPKVDYAGVDWTGFQYGDGFGGYGFEMYGKIGDKNIRISAAGFAYDSEEAKGIIGSLKLK